eukprot:2438249-Rhodomonas_salina.2
MEQFQRIDSSMILAKIQLSDWQKVLQFFKGIQEVDDRQFILEKRHQTLDEAYKVVLNLRQAKTLAAADPTGRGIHEYKSHPSLWDNSEHKTRKKEEKKFKVLTGCARQMTWDKGHCLNCGSSKHKRQNCPDSLDYSGEQEYQKSKKNHKQNKYMEQTDMELEVSTSTESKEDEAEEC